jgi:acyl-CoA thioester hydrolase
MSAPFVTTRRVQFAETDMAGIVHFATYFNYLEEAEHELFRSFGTTIMQRQPDGSVVSWPRVAASCSFEAPAYYDEILEIRLIGLAVGTKSLTQRWEVWRGETRLCRGELKTVCCAFRPGEPMTSMEIPPGLREQLDLVSGE